MIDYLEKYPEMVIMWAGYAFQQGITPRAGGTIIR
jgi:formate-dependent nitrite reductase cytochrome c552 subunit